MNFRRRSRSIAICAHCTGGGWELGRGGPAREVSETLTRIEPGALRSLTPGPSPGGERGDFFAAICRRLPLNAPSRLRREQPQPTSFNLSVKSPLSPRERGRGEGSEGVPPQNPRSAGPAL